MCCSSLTPPTEKLGLSTHYLCNIIVALHETIHDAKHVIPPIAFAGLGDRSMFSNTWADSQVQVLQYQPPDFQQTPQQVSSHWEDNTTKNYQQQQKIKKRSGTGGDGKLQESSLQFLSLPISLLSIHPTIPFLDVLAYQADVEVAVCILNQLVPLNRKASKALVSFKCKEWGFGWWEETPYSVTWGFGTDHQLAIQGARMDRKAPFKKKKKKSPSGFILVSLCYCNISKYSLGRGMPFTPTQGFLPAWIHSYPQGWESQACQGACHASPDNVPVPNYCKLKIYTAHYTHTERLSSWGWAGDLAGKLFYTSLCLQWSFYFPLQIIFQLFQDNSSAHLPKQKYRLLSSTFFPSWLTWFASPGTLFQGRSGASRHLGAIHIRDSPNCLLPALLHHTGSWHSHPSPTAHCLPPCHLRSGMAVLLTFPVLPSALLSLFWLSATSLSPVTWGHFCYTPAHSPSRIAILQHFSLYPFQNLAAWWKFQVETLFLCLLTTISISAT